MQLVWGLFLGRVEAFQTENGRKSVYNVLWNVNRINSNQFQLQRFAVK